MDAANRPNNTRMQELLCLHKAQSTSLRRGRPEFFRQDSPHSIAALSIENDTAKESAINVAVEMVELEDSPPLIIAKSPEVTADAERPTINKLEQDQPQEKVQLPTYIAASALKSCLKKKNCEIKRSIHFYESVAIACIPTLDEYTPSELQAIYLLQPRGGARPSIRNQIADLRPPRRRRSTARHRRQRLLRPRSREPPPLCGGKASPPRQDDGTRLFSRPGPVRYAAGPRGRC